MPSHSDVVFTGMKTVRAGVKPVRLLDFEGSRLPLDPEAKRSADELRSVLTQILTRTDLPPQGRADIASADIFAMVKATVDGARERGEIDADDLRERVGRAVLGYPGCKVGQQ
jgi:hypothetical protein